MLANSEVSTILSVIDVTGRDNCHTRYDVIAFDTSIRLSPRQRLFQGTIRLQYISLCEACAQYLSGPHPPVIRTEVAKSGSNLLLL